MAARFIHIVVALIAAGVVTIAVFFLVAVAVGWFGLDDFHSVIAIGTMAVKRVPESLAKAIVIFGFVAASLVGVLLLFEALRVRAWIWYGIAAVVFVLAANLIYGMLFSRYVPPQVWLPSLFYPAVPLAVLSALAALAGSLVYWLLAGRKASEKRRLRAMSMTE